MIKRELTETEIRQALLLPDPNQRKSFAQGLIIDHLVQVKKLLVTAHTRFGKGYLLKSLLLRYRKVSQQPVNIVLYSNPIRDELKPFLTGIPNLRFFLLAGYTTGKLPPELYQCGILIIDEAHHALGEAAGQFNTAIPRTTAPLQLYLSATVDNQQKAFLERQGIINEFSVPLKTGVRLGIVPGYQNLNIPVEFTPLEQSQYRILNDRIAERLRLFERISPNKADKLAAACCPPVPNWNVTAENVGKTLGISGSAVTGAAINYRAEKSKRANLLYNAEAKITITLELLNLLPRQKIILFGSRLAMGEELARLNPLIQVYKTGSTRAAKALSAQIMANFYSELKPYLYGCKTLNEGFTVNDCSTAIDMGTSSKQLRAIQSLGRLLGLDANNPDKMGNKINLYVDDFTVGKVVYESMEKLWLKNSQKDQLFTFYLDSIDELADYIPNLNLSTQIH